jgi:hypothetical protein
MSIEDGSWAKFMSKANGQAAKMSFSGHALMENRNGQRGDANRRRHPPSAGNP